MHTEHRLTVSRSILTWRGRGGGVLPWCLRRQTLSQKADPPWSCYQWCIMGRGRPPPHPPSPANRQTLSPKHNLPHTSYAVGNKCHSRLIDRSVLEGGVFSHGGGGNKKISLSWLWAELSRRGGGWQCGMVGWGDGGVGGHIDVYNLLHSWYIEGVRWRGWGQGILRRAHI